MTYERPIRGEAFSGINVSTNGADALLTLTSFTTLEELVVGPLDTVYLTGIEHHEGTAVTGYGGYDFVDLGVAEDITAIVDDAGGDSISVAGDFSRQWSTGRVLTIAGSTSNDGNVTSAGATYDRATNTTTVSLAAGTLTDATLDGNVTGLLADIAGRRLVGVIGAGVHRADFGADGTPLPKGAAPAAFPGGAAAQVTLATGFIIRG